MNEHLEKRLRDKGITPAEVKRAITGAEPDAPLPERLRNPRTSYRPVELREEAAARIEALERELSAARQIERNVQAAREAEHRRAEDALRKLDGLVGDLVAMASDAQSEIYKNRRDVMPSRTVEDISIGRLLCAQDALAAHRARTETKHDR